MSKVNVAVLRRNIRRVMSLADDRPWTVEALLEHLKLILPGVTVDDVKHGLGWNQDQGYIRKSYDHEAEVDAWMITESGLANTPAN